MIVRHARLAPALIIVALLAATPVRAARSVPLVATSYVATLKKPCGIAIDSKDRKIIADTGNDRVIVLDKDFDPVGVIEGLSRKSSRLSQPHGVACDARDRILVADTGNHCVKVFDRDGDYLLTIGNDGSPGSRAGLLRSPEGVVVDKRGHIIVFDTGNRRVQIFDSTGDYIMQFNSGTYSVKRLAGPPDNPVVSTLTGGITLERPVRGCLLDNGDLVVADYEAGRFSVWRYDTARKTALPIKYTEPKEFYPDTRMGDVAYDPEHNEIFYLQSHMPLTIHDRLFVARVDEEALRRYPEELRPLKSRPEDWPPYYETNNFASGRLIEPRGMAVDSKGNVVIVDRAQNFAVQIDREQIETEWKPGVPPLPHRLIDVGTTSALIEYDTHEAVPTVFEYGPLEDFSYLGPHAFTARVAAKKSKKHHRVRLGGLEPGTRYIYRYLATRSAYPREHFSEARVVTTHPRKGRTAYLNLDVLVVLFTDVVTMPKPEDMPKDDDGNPVYPDKPGPMTPEQIARVKADLERARGFYWLNSHMKMNLRFTYLEIDTHHEGFPFSRYAYYPDADRKKLDEIITSHGYPTHGQRGGIVVIYGARHWDAGKKEWVLSGSGGNTWGSSHDGSAICVFNAGGDTAWLFTHEYGHQLDIMASTFGHRYHFNHFHDNLLVGDYGTHWDGNAYIARDFAPDSYLANFYGSVQITRDADNDGFPDDDPRCPYDEKRFGTRSYSADSDDDGVGDLAEAMFSEWLTLDFETFGARTAQPYVRPKPYSADTDGDSIADADDAFPLYPVWPEAGKADIVVDGRLGKDEWKAHSSRLIDDPVFKGAVRVNWRDDGLCFLIEQAITTEQAAVYRTSQRPMRVLLQLDGNNDGWTVGSDNTQFNMDVIADGKTKIETVYCDNSIRGKTVWKRNTVIKPDEVQLAWSVTDDRFVLELMIPANVEAGLLCVEGQELGYNLVFFPAGAPYGLRLFEPQVLFDVTLH